MKPRASRGVSARSNPPSRGSANDNDVGQVLRSVYQKAVEETIPPEMLDLLSKLD